MDWSRMVYSPVGSSDLLKILGCMNSNFVYLSFFTLHSTIFSILSPLSQIIPPSLFSPLSNSNVFETQMCLKWISSLGGLHRGCMCFLRNDGHIQEFLFARFNLCARLQILPHPSPSPQQWGAMRGGCIRRLVHTVKANHKLSSSPLHNWHSVH